MTKLRSTLRSLIVIGCAAVAGSAMTGCRSVDTAVDCTSICDRYKACFQSDYDTSACEARCKTMSGDRGFAALVESCHDCIGGSCNSTGFACAQECSGVVP